MLTRRFIIAALVLTSAGFVSGSQQAPPFPTGRVLSHRDQATHVKQWIVKRFDEVLPALMRREGIDMWVVVSREYNDDPVFRSMAPLTTFSSRRRTILVFSDKGGKVERASIGRFDYDGVFTVVQTPNDGQWDGLKKYVADRDPKVIGVNTSDAWNHADGLTANEKDPESVRLDARKRGWVMAR